MKYEICKGIQDGDSLIWTAIAWSDVKPYAEYVLSALSLAYDNRFAILCNGKVIKES
ncbi:hypothetical protein [Desulfuribacillus stibiiarsenatis]|uniref:hypothetical protein n=1 Tax=Desulfuribacillus stibiiarsenatis TaxID=1390249 RepID=UPI0015B54A25|nr:hypothetical protein [Desulfuribacillus stibiiarsenatis]